MPELRREVLQGRRPGPPTGKAVPLRKDDEPDPWSMPQVKDFANLLEDTLKIVGGSMSMKLLDEIVLRPDLGENWKFNWTSFGTSHGQHNKKTPAERAALNLVNGKRAKIEDGVLVLTTKGRRG